MECLSKNALQIHESFGCRTTNTWLLISDTMSTFQTNAGNIVLTSSKLHIRAVHHTLSEIWGKKVIWLSRYRNKTKSERSKIAGRRKWKAWLRSQKTHFPFPYLIIHFFFNGDSRALPISPLAATDPFGWWGHYLFHP